MLHEGRSTLVGHEKGAHLQCIIAWLKHGFVTVTPVHRTCSLAFRCISLAFVALKLADNWDTCVQQIHPSVKQSMHFAYDT